MSEAGGVAADGERRPPARILIPLAGLRVPKSWSVGSVTIHPGGDAAALIAATPPFAVGDGVVRDHVEAILSSAATSSIADVVGPGGIDTAIDRVREALDILRLFQIARRTTHTTSFGLPGDVYMASIEYVAVWENSGPGWRHLGDHIGWEFKDDAYEDWCASRPFQFLSSAAASPLTEGQRRAVTGARLLARASAEHRPDLKMLGAVMALEAWVLPDVDGPQKFRLARYVTQFACRRDDGRACAGAGSDCPYLRLDPADKKDLTRLKKLPTIGGGWTCSAWVDAVDWYEARSASAHGRGQDVMSKEASSAEYVISHYLLEPILEWLASHPDDPTGELERKLRVVVDEVGWQKVLDAIDGPIPAELPPIS